jgi:hypothetical protein
MPIPVSTNAHLLCREANNGFPTCQTLAENDEAQARAAGDDDTTREGHGTLLCGLGLVDRCDRLVRHDSEPMPRVATDAVSAHFTSLWSHDLESLRVVHDTVAVYAVRRVKARSPDKGLRKLAQYALASVVSSKTFQYYEARHKTGKLVPTHEARSKFWWQNEPT